MDHKSGLKICILLCSITYQIWAILTVLVVLLYANDFFGIDTPSFILAYVKSIKGFIDHPKNIPFSVLFSFVLGGVCMGIALSNNAIEYMENWFKSLRREEV